MKYDVITMINGTNKETVLRYVETHVINTDKKTLVINVDDSLDLTTNESLTVKTVKKGDYTFDNLLEDVYNTSSSIELIVLSSIDSLLDRYNDRSRIMKLNMLRKTCLEKHVRLKTSHVEESKNMEGGAFDDFAVYAKRHHSLHSMSGLDDNILVHSTQLYGLEYTMSFNDRLGAISITPNLK